MRLIILCFSFLYCFSTFASENFNYKKAQETKKFNLEMCISTKTNVCVSQVCLNSEEIDCQDNCAEHAKDVCS